PRGSRELRRGRRTWSRCSSAQPGRAAVPGAAPRNGRHAARTYPGAVTTAEHRRLADSDDPTAPWRRWGPYVSARQWGTVREDYSADGDAWAHFPFDHAHRRAYRWGEDGIAGLCDVDGHLNLAVAMWNGRDDRLKERFFGLTNPQGNH